MENHFNQGYISSYPPPNQQPPPLGSFGNLSAQNHQQESPSHPTLPPLQSQNGGYQFGNLSFGHGGNQSQTPTTPHTPVTSSMGGHNASTYSHLSPTNPQPGSMLPPSSFNQPYAMSQSLQYPSSTATSLPSSSAPSGLPTIRPMPPGGIGGPMSGLPSLASTGQMGQQPSFLQNEEAPTHVVGSQGRRGILPSAPGRPNPPAQGTTQNAKSLIPQKDQDGKFPCPHCNKTYLHAKHLKRHLLRHTGDRPYMCHLCKDTFSRSDILKRHFQKCSIRRGNPTGANHLAHQRRNTNSGQRLSISQQDGPIGLAGLQDVTGNTYNNGIGSSPTVNGEMSTRTSRANSIVTPGGMSHRNSIAGLGILGSNAPNNEQMTSSAAYQQSLPAFAMPNSTTSGPMQPNYAYSTPQMNGTVFNNQPQQMSFLGHPSSRFANSHENSPHTNDDNNTNNIDWNGVFSQGGQDGFISSHSANASSQGRNNVKTEQDSKTVFNMQNNISNESFLGSLYSHPGAFGSEYGGDDSGILGFPTWNLDDPLQGKVESLVQYCFPNGADSISRSPAAELVKNCLTAENVKRLAEHYTSFHGHWPILHMPTFKLAEANNALVLAIICIGAIYSPQLNVTQTRQMMDFVKTTIMRNCSLYRRFVNGQTSGMGTTSSDVEELQALIMLQSMFTWHGEPHQRQAARNEFPTLVRIAKALGLSQTAPPGHYAYSLLHAGQANSPHFDVNKWSWQSWLEQEKRNRALYLLFLLDAALGIFFNSTPQFDPFEIRLCLPADDAAWDAKDAQSCASALGLLGPSAQSVNLTGTRRFRQPGMREAMRTLVDPSVHFQPGATNAYSKFVLIHALIVRIIACQKTLLQPDSTPNNFHYGFSGSTPATPLSQNDWLEQRSTSGSISANSSGHATPTDALSPRPQTPSAAQEKKRLGYALDRWKRAWDTDMELQYPAGQTQFRRFGFSRDGVHFFYLGRSFLQSQRAADWTAPSDVRFKQVMSLLKRIKAFVLGDNESKGQDIGSVGDIDDQYGLDSLTLDMKLLFKPYNSQLDSPVASVQTYSL